MSDKIEAIIVEEVEIIGSNEKDDDFDFIEDMERFDSVYNAIRSDMYIDNDRLNGKDRINELQIENSDYSSNGERDIMKSVCPFCGKNALILKKRKKTILLHVLVNILFNIFGWTFYKTIIHSPFIYRNKYHYICSNCKHERME